MKNFLNKIKRKPIRAEAKWGCQQKGSFSEEKNDELTYPIPGIVASVFDHEVWVEQVVKGDSASSLEREN